MLTPHALECTVPCLSGIQKIKFWSACGGLHSLSSAQSLHRSKKTAARNGLAALENRVFGNNQKKTDKILIYC
jgi:hypothetical protein